MAENTLQTALKTNSDDVSNNSNKNLAIANGSFVSCTHNMLRAFIGLNIKP